MILKGFVDRLDVGRLGRCGCGCSDRPQYEEGDKSGPAARSRYNDFTPRHSSHGGGTIHGRKYDEKFPRRHGLKKAGRPGCCGAAARLPKKPGSQKLTPPSSAKALCGAETMVTSANTAIAAIGSIDPR